MKALENVIVTLRLHPKDASLDMELPAFLPMEELADKVLETLRVMHLVNFNDAQSLRFSLHGKAVRGEDTLASLGLWDGSILDASFIRDA